jgi:hypothetical protein
LLFSLAGPLVKLSRATFFLLQRNFFALFFQASIDALAQLWQHTPSQRWLG